MSQLHTFFLFVATMELMWQAMELNLGVMMSQYKQTTGGNCYVSPEIEVLCVEVEGGFLFSNTEDIGGEEPDQEW